MKRILAYGDSNTWGFDAESFTRFSEDIRWTGLLQKALEKDALILEEGLCGRTTVFDDETIMGANGLSALPAVLEADSPLDLAIIMLGTNDCKSVFGASAQEITDGLELCLAKILEVIAPENVLMISPLYLSDAALGYGYNDRSLAVSRELKQKYRELAEKYGTAFLAASDVASASGVDGQHLTAEGHHALFEAVLNIITPKVRSL
jgi:lysophospholipase L1-like esterase